MSELIISKFSGMEIPINNLDFMQWKISLQRNYTLGTNINNGVVGFTLTTLDQIVLNKYLKFKEEKRELLLVDNIKLNLNENEEDLTQSNLLTSLSKKKLGLYQKWVNSITDIVVRINNGSSSMDNLASVMSDEELKNDERYQTILEKNLERNRNLNKIVAKFEKSIASRSYEIHDETRIMDARDNWPEWNDNIEQNYRNAIDDYVDENYSPQIDLDNNIFNDIDKSDDNDGDMKIDDSEIDKIDFGNVGIEK